MTTRNSSRKPSLLNPLNPTTHTVKGIALGLVIAATASAFVRAQSPQAQPEPRTVIGDMIIRGSPSTNAGRQYVLAPAMGPVTIDVLFVYSSAHYHLYHDQYKDNPEEYLRIYGAEWIRHENAGKAAEEAVPVLVRTANEYFENSGLELTVRAAGVVRAPRRIENLERPITACRRAASLYEGDWILALRDANAADIVTVISGCGLAYLGPEPPLISWTTWDAPITFVHELGHNLGLGHHRWGDNGWMPFGHGYCRNYPNVSADKGNNLSTTTVMYGEHVVRPPSSCYTDNSSGDELRGFSNRSVPLPLVRPLDLPAFGRKYPASGGRADAARAIRYAMAQVAAISDREPPPPNPDPSDCEPKTAQISFSHGYEVSACVEYEEREETVQMDAVDYGLDSEQSGLLYFFDRDNAEVLIKVLDACAVNGHRWVFVAPVTDLALNLEVREVATGKRWQYRNPRGGQTAKPRSDTAAFPCDATAASWAIGDGDRRPRLSGGATWAGVAEQVARSEAVRAGLPAHAGDQTDCEPDRPARTLRGGYTVSMCYETSNGEVGDALDWGLDSEQSGLLYFFDRDNVEVLLKVLDGCGVNGHRWVFVAPVTDLAFNLVVESPDGQRWTHSNRLGRTANAANDVSAFPCSA